MIMVASNGIVIPSNASRYTKHIYALCTYINEDLKILKSIFDSRRGMRHLLRCG